jgi:hypothetical protein
MDIEVVPISRRSIHSPCRRPRGALPAATAWQIGTAQYNRMKVATGRWALEEPTGPNDTDGIATWGLAGDLVMGTAAVTNREVNLTFD